ncbi:MAG: YncE family protein [Mycobacterium sp.]
MLYAATIVASGCSSEAADDPPPTIEPATAAVSPAVSGESAGVIRPLGPAASAVFDPAAGALAVLTSGPTAALTLVARSGWTRTIALPGAATALAGDGNGTAFLATRGGYFRVGLTDGSVDRVGVDGQADTDFTAIARRGDGNLVLGSADGAVYTLDSPTSVVASVKVFARVDVLVTQGDTAVVLDRGQTSVTTIDSAGTQTELALRAGEGATTMAVDPHGRVLVVDTRGDELMVFGTDPLIMRQRYPVRNAPYGLVGSSDLTWVSQTADNVVVGYDLDTGIPVEKVRYPTVQQPNSLAFDDATNTLYVVSASGAGVQVIEDAAGPQ